MGLQKVMKNFEKQSKYEKTLILFLTFFAVLAFILFVIVLSNIHQDGNICTTASCIAAADHILQTVDSTLDPCEDFYKFSCGNFFKNGFFRSKPSLMHELKELKKNQVTQLVVLEVPDEDKLPKSYQYVRKFYQKCYNTSEIDEDKDKTFLDSLEKVIGGWPLANGYSVPFDWPEVMMKARQQGMPFDFFLDIGFRISDNDSQVYLEILPPSNYNKDAWSEDKVDLYVKIAALWGRTVPGARAEMLKTMDFAKKLDHISEKCINATMNVTMQHQKLTIGELEKSVKYVPIVSWLDFLKNITNVKNLTEQTVVIVDVTQEYFRELQLLMTHTESKWRANYVAAILLMIEHEYLSEDVRKIAKKISLSQKPNDRMKKCAESAINHFHGAVEAIFIRKVVTPDRKQDILEMLKSIKEKLEVAVNKTEWIDDESKDKLAKFLANMTVGIGWTDLVFDVDEYEKMLQFDKLNLNFDDPLISILHKVNKFRHDVRYDLVGRYKTKMDIEMNVPRLDVNAYFMKLQNLIVLTAPLLQSPMYSLDRPKYMNYGSLGSIIGHELTHGVTHSYEQDREIQRFTSEEYEQIWTNKTKENFENVTQCAIDEYENYESDVTIFGDLMGNETLEENVADFTGINLAYEAYQSWVYNHGHEKLLPGVDFTPNQIFWIMSATYVCIDEKLLTETACKDTRHGEPSFRSNGPIRNSPYFARDFNCRIGSKMNPKDKCRVYI